MFIKVKSPQQYSLGLKSLSLLLAFSFLFTEISYCAPIEAMALASVKPLEALSQDPTRFEAPLDFSSLKEIHKGTNGKLIIHIQDAHSNLSGQQNLASALDQIMTRYGVSLVLVEGGAHDDTLTAIRKIVPQATCKRLAKSLLLDGQIAGEEYLNLTSDHPMKIMGIEDIHLYARSIVSYGKLADKREGILRYLKVIKNASEKLKTRLYPKEIQAYEKRGGEGDRGFESRFKGLVQLALDKKVDLGEFPNVQKMAALSSQEKKIDFQAANLEQTALVEEISKRGGKDDFEGYIKKILQTKNSKASQFSFFQNIFTIAKEKNISLKRYPNLLLYGDYLKAFSAIDLDLVLEELTRLEDRVYVAWLPDKDARLLRAIDRYVTLLETAYHIQMTTQEFDFFQANEPDFATAAYLAFINRKLADLGYMGDLVPYENILEEGKEALAAFYDSVDKRDAAFVQNTERILKEENQKVAVLITGGYHTPHLKKLIEDKGYSWAVLTPVVTSETNQKKYESLLLAPLRKEAKKVEVVEGEYKTKSLSVLEKDLILAKKKEGVRKEDAFESEVPIPTLLTGLTGGAIG